MEQHFTTLWEISVADKCCFSEAGQGQGENKSETRDYLHNENIEDAQGWQVQIHGGNFTTFKLNHRRKTDQKVHMNHFPSGLSERETDVFPLHRFARSSSKRRIMPSFLA